MHVQDIGHRSNSAFTPWDNYTDVSKSPIEITRLLHHVCECCAYTVPALALSRAVPSQPGMQEVTHPEWWPEGYLKHIDAEHNACYDPGKVG